MKLWLTRQQETSFDEVTAWVIKELFAARSEFAAFAVESRQSLLDTEGVGGWH